MGPPNGTEFISWKFALLIVYISIKNCDLGILPFFSWIAGLEKYLAFFKAI